MFSKGDVLKYNTLWKAGNHYNYQFFRVSHVTEKGNVMGWNLPPDRVLASGADENRTLVLTWIVDFSHVPSSRLVRLKNKNLWFLISEEEKEAGKVTATSCVY